MSPSLALSLSQPTYCSAVTLFCGETEGDVVREGVVAEEELELGLRFSGVHVVGALPAHDVAGAFREHGLVAHVVHHFADAVGVDELRVAESGGLYAKEFFNLGGVLLHLGAEFRLVGQGGQGMIIGFGQEFHLAGFRQGLEAGDHFRGEALELLQGAAGNGIGKS